MLSFKNNRAEFPANTSILGVLFFVQYTEDRWLLVCLIYLQLYNVSAFHNYQALGLPWTFRAVMTLLQVTGLVNSGSSALVWFSNSITLLFCFSPWKMIFWDWRILVALVVFSTKAVRSPRYLKWRRSSFPAEWSQNGRTSWHVLTLINAALKFASCPGLPLFKVTKQLLAYQYVQQQKKHGAFGNLMQFVHVYFLLF